MGDPGSGGPSPFAGPSIFSACDNPDTVITRQPISRNASPFPVTLHGLENFGGGI